MAVVEKIGGSGAGAQFLPCWSCKGPVASRALFCHTCGAVQPPGSLDHFARLGMERDFDIDGDRLEKQYLGFQRVLHPDRFAGKPARERAIAESQSVALNEAYETLGDPLKRGIYLLKLSGLESEAAAEKTVSDPALLVEAMEQREALAGSEDPETVEALMAEAASATIALIAEMSRAFAGDDLVAAGRSVLRMRYLRKFLEDARLKRAAMEP